MHAKETRIKDLLEGTKQFIVPLFQRSYCWEKKQWETFYDDITDLVEKNQNSSHFIGSIVTADEGNNPAGVSRFTIIDGQQRITTILIILLAIRDTTKDNNLADEIEKTFLLNYYKSGEDQHKLLTSEFDKETYLALINKKDVSDKSLLAKAYLFFKNKISKFENLGKLKDVLINNLTTVSIVLGKDDNPYLVYETLNYKGKPLTYTDLIRNYILMCIDVDKQKYYYKEYWKKMEELLEDNLSEYIRHYFMRNGEIVKKIEIYDKLKYTVDKITATTYLTDLAKYATLYNKIINPDKENDEKLKSYFNTLKELELSVTYPFVLSFYILYFEKEIEYDIFVDVLRILENYLIRRAICNYHTYQLKDIFSSFLKNKLQDEMDVDIITSLKNHLQGKNYPDDKKFEESIKEKELYINSKKNKRTELLLKKIEEFYGHKEKVDLQNITIEHIMPQTLTDWWENHLGEEFQEVHTKYLNKLANLTITKYNAEISNKPFDEKKIFYKDSHFEMTKEISKYENWKEEDILKREKELINILLKIFPYFSEKINKELDPNDPTGKKVNYIVLFGDRIKVQNWVDALLKTLNKLYFLDENKFNEFVNYKHNYFSKDKDELYCPKKLNDNLDLFVELNLSARALVRLCKTAIKFFGYEENEWEFITKTEESNE